MPLVFDVPIDESTASTVVVTVPATRSVRFDHIRFDPLTSFVNGGLSLEADGLRDLLGRPFTLSHTDSIRVNQPSLGLDAAAENAEFGRSGDKWYAAPPKGQLRFSFVVRLKPPPGSRTLRIRHRFDCTTSSPGARLLTSVFSPSGHWLLKTKCATAFADETLALPSDAAYLWAEGELDPPLPCWSPWTPTLPRYEIEKISYEP